MKLYNTLSRKEEEFAPSGDQVKMYVCGITPYAPCHVGHAMSYVIFDVLRRYLESGGYNVHHVQNFTDIDDKIINRASDEGVTYRELADRYIEEFTSNMDRLNVRRAHDYPLATAAIPKIVEVIGGLIDNGSAYSANGDVYFRVTKDLDYGKLSHRSLESMIAGARVGVIEGKEHPMDFTLWKAAKAGEPAWDSPWGAGRPGWHIECTTICLDRLGNMVDIHGGGQDLIFPHHENEIAQSESYTDEKPFARFWVHNGLLQLDEEKMSKSLGNLVGVTEALERYSPDALRLFFLSSHYHAPLNYSDQGVAAMERAVERLRTALRQDSPKGGGELDSASFKEKFVAAMDSDLNTPQAMAALFDLAHEINRARERGQAVSQAQDSLRKLGDLLGLTFREWAPSETLPLEPIVALFNETRSRLDNSGLHKLAEWVNFHSDTQDVATIIDTLLAIRRELRQAQEYDLADTIRSGLTELGISLEDTRERTTWRSRQPVT